MAIDKSLGAMIPITRFNKGEASKIFREVSTEGDKIVLKNNMPTCILMNPNRYKELIESLEDFALYLEAEKRIKENTETISHEEVLAKLDITKEALESPEEDVEIE